MIIPEFQPALTALKEGQYTLNPTHPLPSHSPLPPSYILIRVSFVTLNPCNWKMVDFSPAIGTVGGNDFSGRVVAIGSTVRKWQIGDSVCGFLYGLDPHVGEGEWAGASAEYVSIPGDLVMRVVEEKVKTALGALSLCNGASTGSRKATTGPYILVHGGSTATGTIAIQLARLAGYSPIMTCSPGHNALVQSYGAVKAFDYRSASCGVAIRAFTKRNYLLFSTTARKDVQSSWVMALTIFGKPVDLKGPFGRDAVPGDYEWAAKWYKQAGKLVEEGLLRPHPASVRSGGWEGLEELRCGLVKGKELVYAVGE
ncbi:hypothetical protein BDV41DRAFT_577071 [Aspergillus transmontanensis]|uniref:Enoyl reductase (ER) domain-containing protein n=1 Tax=Aspergillus transmontanensis TaxID=1034304 RepID=A0A5N6VY03_9EURO|nr:hypothetical protein BDV41DRAFT_577071 [Aspergillus transmontanensis]